MKKTFLLLVLCYCTSLVFAQSKNENGLKFRSISAGFGVCVGKINDGGLNFYIDATTALKKNLFIASIVTGGEAQIDMGGSIISKRNFKEFDLLYGREMNVYKFFKIETHIGLAVFNEIYRNGTTNFNDVSETVIGLPIKIKILLYSYDHFALGINPNVTINSIDTMYSGNLILQYKFQ